VLEDGNLSDYIAFVPENPVSFNPEWSLTTMKKMLLIMSASSFAILNFSTSIGVLVMRDVVVDDTTVYDSVTLQLNLANGTFTILDATLRDATFENTVIDSVTHSGLKVDFYGCVLTGKTKSPV
jgi:hypothetical protein